MIDFSFVVPVYNMDQYVSSCVDSIIEQCDEHCEIILIDDGSKDNSGKICDEISQKHDLVKVIHKKNGGVSAARKDGVDIANGRYILFVDSDDWVSDNLIEELRKVISSNEVDYICFGLIYETKEHKFLESLPKQRPGLYCKEEIVKEIYPYLVMDSYGRQFNTSLNGKCFRKEICKHYMIEDHAATMGEDTSVSVSCLANSKTVFILDKCLSYYRYNDSSATKGHKIFNWDNPYACNYFIEKNIPVDKYGFQSQVWRKTAYDVSSVVITRFYQDKSYRQITKEISDNIEFPYYKKAIDNACFNGFNRYSIMLYALKRKMFFMFYLYSRIKD